MRSNTAVVAYFIVLAVLIAILATASGCAVHAHVDKRVWQTTHVHVENDTRSSFGSASAPTTVTTPGTVTNTSETKTDAEQAVDGTLTLPLIP